MHFDNFSCYVSHLTGIQGPEAKLAIGPEFLTQRLHRARTLQILGLAGQNLRHTEMFLNQRLQYLSFYLLARMGSKYNNVLFQF